MKNFLLTSSLSRQISPVLPFLKLVRDAALLIFRPVVSSLRGYKATLLFPLIHQSICRAFYLT